MALEKSEKEHNPTDKNPPERKNTHPLQMTEQNFFPPGKLKFPQIRKIIIQCFRQNRYEQLERELSKHGFLDPQKVEKFFLKEGGSILYYALTLNTSSDKPLAFLAAKNSIVPKQILQTVLRKDNFSALRIFLYAEKGFESSQNHTPKSQELQIKKFKFLLNIDNDGVNNFMQENANDEHLQTAIITQNFAEAKRQFIAENNLPDAQATPLFK